jgi:hypothetical protein
MRPLAAGVPPIVDNDMKPWRHWARGETFAAGV